VQTAVMISTCLLICYNPRDSLTDLLSKVSEVHTWEEGRGGGEGRLTYGGGGGGDSDDVLIEDS
jgi:hypothetical protein